MDEQDQKHPQALGKAKDGRPVAGGDSFLVQTESLGPLAVQHITAGALSAVAPHIEGLNAEHEQVFCHLVSRLASRPGQSGLSLVLSVGEVKDLTRAERDEIARGILIQEEWASPEEASSEDSPQRRVANAVCEGIASIGAAYKGSLDTIGSLLSPAARKNILDSSLLSEQIKKSLAGQSMLPLAPKYRSASESLLAAVKKLDVAPSLRQAALDMNSTAKLRDAVGGLNLRPIDLPRPSEWVRTVDPIKVPQIPPNPLPAIARETAKSTAEIREAMDRVEKLAADSAGVIAGIHDVIRDTSLAMSENSVITGKQTKRSLTIAAWSLALAALFGLISAITGAMSVYYVLHPPLIVAQPVATAETGRSAPPGAPVAPVQPNAAPTKPKH